MSFLKAKARNYNVVSKIKKDKNNEISELSESFIWHYENETVVDIKYSDYCRVNKDLTYVMKVFKVQVKIGQLLIVLTFSLTNFAMAVQQKLFLTWEFSNLRNVEESQTILLQFQNLVRICTVNRSWKD